jgi:hypothetical protein
MNESNKLVLVLDKYSQPNAIKHSSLLGQLLSYEEYETL